MFIPYLRESGFEVTVSDTTESYLDLDGTDLVLQCVTMGQIEPEHFKGLDAAIRKGTGFAGWHGGICRLVPEQRRLQLRHRRPVHLAPARVSPTTGSTSSPSTRSSRASRLRRAHRAVLRARTTRRNTVLATTTFRAHPDYPWIEGAVMPAVWTRTWGAGKVFVCTVGHKLDDLEVPEVRTIIERGLLWASK